MVGGRPGPRGDFSSVTAPDSFPSTFDPLINKTIASLVIFNGTASEETFTTDIPVGNCLGWTVYVTGTGDWNVQVAPKNNDNEAFWTDIISTDITDSGLYESVGYHPHARVVMKAGFTGIVWIYRRYATF